MGLTSGSMLCMQVAKALASGPEVIKLLSCSIELNTEFILLISVKRARIVGTSTFISMINTISERLKARNFFTCW